MVVTTGFVYILGSSAPSGYSTYVGWTLDLERRLAEHNSGKGTRSTRGRATNDCPWHEADVRRADISVAAFDIVAQLTLCRAQFALPVCSLRSAR
jgi:predicted GIY-YIG superfamily endonuclease